MIPDAVWGKPVASVANDSIKFDTQKVGPKMKELWSLILERELGEGAANAY